MNEILVPSNTRLQVGSFKAFKKIATLSTCKTNGVKVTIIFGLGNNGV